MRCSCFVGKATRQPRGELEAPMHLSLLWSTPKIDVRPSTRRIFPFVACAGRLQASFWRVPRRQASDQRLDVPEPLTPHRDLWKGGGVSVAAHDLGADLDQLPPGSSATTALPAMGIASIRIKLPAL
jgi:hypothetical protein